MAAFAGMALFFGGCSGLSDHYGLGHFVLTIRKISPAQQQDAQERVNRYFTAVKNHQKPRPWRRYIAVKTLDPNPKQVAKYLQAKAAAQKKAESEDRTLGPEWTEPSQLHCIMVFDVQTREVVGSGCYVVSSEPQVGQVTAFEHYEAEYVGQ
jgi:hypothetical protein